MVRKLTMTASLLLGLWSSVCPSWAQTITQSSVRALPMWVKHYPFDTVLGHKGFYSVPWIKAKMASLLSRQDIEKVVSTYSVATPIAMVSGYLVISGCMPHNCNDEGDTMLIDVHSGDLVVGFMDNHTGPAYKNMSERIYGTTDYTRLPGNVFALLFSALPAGR